MRLNSRPGQMNGSLAVSDDGSTAEYSLKSALDVSSRAPTEYLSLPGTDLWFSTRSFQLTAIVMQMAKIDGSNVRVTVMQRAHLHRNIGPNRLISDKLCDAFKRSDARKFS